MFRTTQNNAELESLAGEAACDTLSTEDELAIEDPTSSTYRSFVEAHQFFNRALFRGELDTPLFTLQRKARVLGYYAPKRFEPRPHAGDADETQGLGKPLCDEIALNPSTLRHRSDEEVASTLVHEMAHQHQQWFGQPSRSGYHNREWADLMVRIGLIPSHTGAPGGDRVGQRMSHYIEPDGAFQRAFKELAGRGFRFVWQERGYAKRPSRKKDRVKFSCPSCEQNAWARPSAMLVCGECALPLRAAS